MAEKTLKTRIALLYKTYADWNAVKDTYKPLKGEVCICEVPQSAGVVAAEPALLMKVGDGVKSFGALPWTSALAADVFAWAKKEHLEFDDLTEDFKASIKELVDEKNTLYRLTEVEGGYQLQKSEDGGQTFTDAEGLVDLSGILARLDLAEEGINEAKAAAVEAKAKAEELFAKLQPISEDEIRELFLEHVTVEAGKTVAETLAALGEDEKLVLNSSDVVAENLTVGETAFIDAQGAKFTGDLTVAEGAVIKNAVFTGNVVIG